MTLLIRTLIVLALSSFAVAQSVDTLWTVFPGQSHESETIYEALAMNDGSVVLAGGVMDPDSSRIINGAYKLSPDGATQWVNGFRGLGLGWFRAVTEGNDGTLVFAGQTRIPNQPGATKKYIVKLDQNGDSLWTSIIGADASADASEAIFPASGGGYWVFGQTTEGGQTQFHALKISEDGDSLDSKIYGREWSDYVWEAAQDVDGGFILVGDYWDPLVGNLQGLVMKLDANGDSLWGYYYGGPDDEDFFDVAVDPEGGYMLCGTIVPADDFIGDVFLMKISATGDSLWSRTIGGADDDAAYAIVPVYSGFAMICNTLSFGAGNVDGWLLRVNSAGDTLFSQTFGNSRWQFLWDIVQGGDLGYVFCGASNIAGAGNDGWVLKTTPDPTNIPPDPFELAEPADGAIINLQEVFPLTCTWHAARDLNMDQVTYLFHAELNGGTAFLQNPNGMLADTFYNLEIDVPLDRLDESSFIDWYVDATDGTDTVSTSSGTWQFRIDYASDVESPSALPNEVSLAAYPNPFNPAARVQFDLPQDGHVKLGIYDITGRLVEMLADELYSAGSHVLEFSGASLPSGTYFARITHHEETRITKLVLMK